MRFEGKFLVGLEERELKRVVDLDGVVIDLVFQEGVLVQWR